jgi:hypothetical protein
MGTGTSRSKEEPSPVAGTKTYSMAVAERWERSEAAAAMIERYIELKKSRALPFDRAMIFQWSHTSPASTKESEVCA